VQRNPNDFVEYREYNARQDEADYAHPDYYQQPSEQIYRSFLPVEPLLPYETDVPYEEAYREASEPAEYSANGAEVRRDQGPQGVEGQTSDASAAQKNGGQQRNDDGAQGRKRLGGLGGILVAIGAFLAKFNSLFIIAKFGLAGLSALASVFVYSWAFGWSFAIGLVVLLFIHEMGHALVMKLKGIPVGGMIFIPLMGAAVLMQQMPQNAKDEAEVGIAGPIAGAIASSVCLLIAQTQPGALWASLAYFGFFLNLINLVPILPFDGGRVLAAIDRRVWILGFLLLLAYQVWAWLHGEVSWWLFFFVVIAATQLWSRGFTPSTPQERAYYDVPVSSRIALTVLYFGLAVVLFLGMTISHAVMPAVR